MDIFLEYLPLHFREEEENKLKKTIKMYTLGRFGTYCVALKNNDLTNLLEFETASYAAEGLDKHYKE